MGKSAHLIEIDWPDYGVATPPPRPTREALAANVQALRDAMAGRGLSHLVLYGDREHFANVLWATGFDPRFEECLLVVRREGPPLLLVGNECVSYLRASAAVAAGDIRSELFQPFSLISQPRDRSRRLKEIFADEAIGRGSGVGVVGWKYFSTGEQDDPDHTLDVPSHIADTLRALAGHDHVVNATDLLMHPDHGLRATVTVDEIAAFEFANGEASAAVRRLLFALEDGMTDLDAYKAAAVSGLPLGCHPTFTTGANRSLGLAGPSGERIVRGEPLSFNFCHFGANICRSGWIARGADDLPPAARDYVDAFAGPYLAALSEWFSMMTPGTPGGAVQAMIDARLPFDRYGIALNPGHLIHHDEWLSSPIFPGSDMPLRSGMAMQVDVIPSHPVYMSTRMEDGIVIADESLRATLAERHPDVAARCKARRRFMIEAIGFDVPETVLPLSDTAGIVPPYFLSPRTVIALR
ncbi:MAG TPA: M24 family metallopeptidase [Methylomirabilota bacterium]|nr:M24 family metallopeptidase [Methylomirabilota bacterium]